MKNSLDKISQKSFAKKVVFNNLFLKVSFVFLIIAFSVISYGRAFDYYFWRDDTKVVWMEKHVPALINNFSTLGTARARIGSVFFDFVEYAIFGYEAYSHQFFGFLIRITNVFLIYFFAKLIFRSRKVALVAALLSAGFVGGLEAYSWVRGIGVMITLSLVSFIFYIKSRDRKSYVWLLVSIGTAAVSLSMDIWRTMGIIFVIALWEILHIFSRRDGSVENEETKKARIFRLGLFLTVQFLVLKLVLLGSSNAGGSMQSSANGYVQMALEGSTIMHFFTSIGNLIRSPIFYVSEEGGITDAGLFSTFLGISFAIATFLVFLRFLQKREKSLIPWIVLMVWIPLFYGPNWLYAQKLEVASTHRYIAFSAIVVPILWAKLFVSKLPAKIGAVAVCLFIILSLSHARAVVNHDYTIRGTDFVFPVWQQITNATPIGETNQLLSVTGNNRVVGYVFAWSDIFPFATFKGIGSPSQLPIYANLEIASNVLCDPHTKIPDPITGNFREAGDNFSIGKAYSWFIKDERNIEETTDEFRINIAKKAPCLWKAQNIYYPQEVTLIRTAFVPLKKVDNSYSLLTEWKPFDTANKQTFHYVATLLEGDNTVPLDIKLGKVTFDGKESSTFSDVSFIFEMDPKKKYFAGLFVCKKDCTSSHIGALAKLNLNELVLLSMREFRP